MSISRLPRLIFTTSPPRGYITSTSPLSNDCTKDFQQRPTLDHPHGQRARPSSLFPDKTPPSIPDYLPHTGHRFRMPTPRSSDALEKLAACCSKRESWTAFVKDGTSWALLRACRTAGWTLPRHAHLPQRTKALHYSIQLLTASPATNAHCDETAHRVLRFAAHETVRPTPSLGTF